MLSVEQFTQLQAPVEVGTLQTGHIRVAGGIRRRGVGVGRRGVFVGSLHPIFNGFYHEA